MYARGGNFTALWAKPKFLKNYLLINSRIMKFQLISVEIQTCRDFEFYMSYTPILCPIIMWHSHFP